MHVTLKYAFIAFVCVALSATTTVAQVRVVAQVDSSGDIYVGENFGYYVVIEGAEKAGQVDLRPLREYQPKSTGNRQQSSTRIINSRVTTTQTIIMTYLLTANRTGRVPLLPVTVTLDGKTYQTNPVDANILKPGTTELLDLEMSLFDTRCYVGQPVILTVNFYFSANIGDFQLDVPAFTSGDFDLDDDDIADSQAREFQLHTGTRVFVKQYRVEHNSKDSMLVTFSKVLIPKRAGTIPMEPVTVSADVAVGRARTRDSLFGSNIQYKRFMVGSEPTKLNVLNLPEQDRPEDFYGLIGIYTISASAAPTKVSVGDPITLNISIGGSQYLKPVQWPALEQIPELAENFKIPSQKASPTIQNNVKVFTQTIRANNDRVTEIPSIPLVYFNP